MNGVIKGKLLEYEILIQQAANNSKEQFANSPDLSQALGSEQIREGLKDTLLGPAQLWEALRAKGQNRLDK